MNAFKASPLIVRTPLERLLLNGCPNRNASRDAFAEIRSLRHP